MIKRTILGVLVVLVMLLVMLLTACGSSTAEISVAEPPVAAAEASGNTPASGTEPSTAPTEASRITPTEPPAELAAQPIAETPVEPAAEPPAEAGGTASTLDEGYPDALPVFMQLVVGTMLLEETSSGVTAEQAQELLPLWQMFRAVRRGDAPPSLEEINAITDQIMAAMTPEQLGAIRGMQITQDDVRAFTLNNSIPQGSGQGSGGGQMGSGDTQNLSPEERRKRMITGGGKNLVDELIRRLEIWGG